MRNYLGCLHSDCAPWYFTSESEDPSLSISLPTLVIIWVLDPCHSFGWKSSASLWLGCDWRRFEGVGSQIIKMAGRLLIWQMLLVVPDANSFLALFSSKSPLYSARQLILLRWVRSDIEIITSTSSCLISYLRKLLKTSWSKLWVPPSNTRSTCWLTPKIPLLRKHVYSTIRKVSEPCRFLLELTLCYEWVWCA